MRIQVLHPIARRIVQAPKHRLCFSTMVHTAQPKFSEGEDGDKLMVETAGLFELEWTLDDTQQGLEKTFNFPSYAKALVSTSLRQ